MTETTTERTELTIPDVATLPAIFGSPEKADELFERVKAAAMSEAPDLSTASGRKRIASLAYKVAQTKSAVDAAGKQLGDDARKQVAAIDATRRDLREKFDALKADVRRPLDEWEAVEEAKAEAVAAHLSRLDAGDANPSMDPSAIEARIADVQAAATGPECGWCGKDAIATAKAEGALSSLRATLSAARQRVADEAELAKLRAAAAERERKDQEAAAARAAAEREAQEREAARQLEAAAAAERQAAAEREAQEAERRKAEAERREAEAAERAAREERERIQREQEAAEAAERRRQADREHRGKVMGEAKSALIAAGLSEADAKAAVIAITAGEVPHVSIRF